MRSRLRWFVTVIVGGALLCLTFAPLPAGANGPVINVFFNGQQLQFDDAHPVIVSDRTLVPFRKLFETFGYQVAWVDSARQAIGVRDGLEIALTIDSTIATVNGKAITLDVPAQIINNRTMVPLRFVSENSGYQVTYERNGDVATIGIFSGGVHPNPDPITPPASPKPDPVTPPVPYDPPAAADQVEPYVVKGRVTDEEGKGLAGARVYADNQLLYDSNLEAVTDAEGYYRIELDRVAVTWHMSAYYTTEVAGEPFEYRMSATADEPFAGNTGAIRNFVLRDEGFVELFVYAADWFDNPYDDSMPPMEHEFELTLTPVYDDGSEGKSFTTYGYNFPGGFGLNSLPLGRYKISAVWKREGQEPVPALVRVRDQGEYLPAIEFGFGTLVPGIRRAEIEIKLPVPKPGSQSSAAGS